MPRPVDDRYEPLPGLAQLPAFVWRRLSRAARIGLVVLAAGAIALAVALAPGIQRSNKERARAEAAEAARLEKQQLERMRREQRPRFARGKPAGTDVAARQALVASAVDSIRADASTRAAAGEFNGPIKRVQCGPYPPGADAVPADQVPSRRTGRYSCLAVTSDIPATSGNREGVVGHPYVARIDFASGRYAFCKVHGRPGELAVKGPSSVALPRECGG
jgi:type II secretory pathway pseudopilin PulG